MHGQANTKILNYSAKWKAIQLMTATLLNFLISFKGGHCDYLSRAPEVLATPLTLNIVNLLRRGGSPQSLVEWQFFCRVLLYFVGSNPPSPELLESK